jgi:hypothetical protein
MFLPTMSMYENICIQSDYMKKKQQRVFGKLYFLIYRPN